MSNKKDIYNKWHKYLYQTNLQEDTKNASKINHSVMQQLKISPWTGGRLLDVACGKGLLLYEIRKINKKMQLYGSDISDYAISQAQKNVEASFSVDDGGSLSLKSNFFDYVTCIGGLEYYDNPAKGIKEISRVLKKNGACAIYVANLMFLGFIFLAMRYGSMPSRGGSLEGNQKIYDYNDEKFYTYKGWVDILEKGGLKVIRSDAFRYLGGVRVMPRWFMFIYNAFLKNLIPYNLTSTFIFICKKR